MNKQIYLNGWLIDQNTNTLIKGTEKRKIEHKQMLLLMHLVKNHGQDITKDELINTIWAERVVTPEILSVAVSNLRKALGDNAKAPSFIKTVPGLGYRLIADTELKEPNLTDTSTEQNRSPNKKTPKASLTKPLPQLVFFMGVWLYFVLFWESEQQPSPVLNLSTEISAEFSQQLHQGQRLLQSSKQEDWRQAIELFTNIATEHPQNSEGYYGLAMAKKALFSKRLGDIKQELTDLLTKVVNLDKNHAGAHFELARLYFLYHWNFEKAEHEFKLSIALAPDNSQIYLEFAQYLLALGRFEESLENAETVRKLNPLTYSIPNIAWIYNMQRKYSQAWQELDKLLLTEPDSLVYNVSAQSVKENMGQKQQSFEYLQAILKLEGYSPQKLAIAHNEFEIGGLAAVNRWLLEAEQESSNIGQYTPPLSWARYAIVAGEYDNAITLLYKALEKRQLELLWVNVDPKYDPLRKHPDFVALIKKIGLDKQAP